MSLNSQMIQTSKNIRKVCVCSEYNLVILGTIQQLLLYDLQNNSLLYCCKRVGSFRNMFLSPSQRYLLVTYSDNYCILYQITRDRLEKILIILGTTNDIRDIKYNNSGFSIIFGNLSFFQVHSLSTGQLQAYSQKFLSVSTYFFGANQTRIFLGRINGDLTILKAERYLNKHNLLIQQLKRQKIFQQCIVQINELQYNQSQQQQLSVSNIVCVSYKLQIAIVEISQQSNYLPQVCIKHRVNSLTTNPLQREIQLYLLKIETDMFKIRIIHNWKQEFNIQVCLKNGIQQKKSDKNNLNSILQSKKDYRIGCSQSVSTNKFYTFLYTSKQFQFVL